MNNKTLLNELNRIGACESAIEWVKEHGGAAAEIWQDCRRGDWMAWYIARQPKLNKTPEFYLAIANCASLSLKYFEEKYPKDKRPRKAIETLRKYARGTATKEQLISAADAAYAAAYAAYAAANAAAAAAADAANAAKMGTLKKCADIFRKYFPANLFE